MAAVQHELFRRQPDLPRLLVKLLGARRPCSAQLARGMDVDLDHAGVGGDGEAQQPRVVGRRVALQHHRAAQSRPRSPRRRRPGRASPRPRTAAARTRGAGRRAARRVSAVRTSRGSAGRPPAGLRHGGNARDGPAQAARPQRWRGGSGVRRERVGLEVGSISVGVGPGQAVERQAQADRAVAGHQEQRVARGGTSGRTASAARRRRPTRRSGSTLPTGAARPWREHPRPAARAPAGRAAGCPRPPRWPAAGAPSTGSSARPRRPAASAAGSTCSRSASASAKRAASSAVGVARGRVRVGQQRRVGPDRLAVGAPMACQRPARQLLARILLAHAVMQRGPRRPQRRQPADQLAGIAAAWSGRARRCSTPPPPGRARRRRSARRPWSGARRPPPAPRPPRAPAARISCHCASV